jgi:hypothetical protein
MVALPEVGKATNTNAWQEITTRKINTTPALGDNDYQYLGQPGYAKYTSFADLIETKSDGSKVFHYFVAIPLAYAYSGITAGSIYHSSDQGKTWNKINPSQSNWGGSIRTGLNAINQTWIDGNGSQWNKKLFLLTNNKDFFGYQWWDAYANFRPSLYRYDGNGLDSNWKELWTDNTLYTAGNAMGSFPFTYGYGSRMFMEELNGQLFFVIYYKNSSTYWDGNYRIRIMRSNTTSLQQLVTNPTITWSFDTIPVNYVTSNYGPPIVYAFKKAGDYLFLSTCMNNNPSQNVESSSGLFFRSNPGGIGWTQAPSPSAPIGYAGGINRNTGNGTGQFQLRIGADWYTAYYNSNTKFFAWGWDYSWYIVWYSWGGATGGYWQYWFQNSNVMYKYSSINSTTKQVWVTDVANSSSYQNLSGGPSPLSLEYFKGYLYAGYGNGATAKLRRTNVFAGTTGLDHSTWTDCGAITAPDDTNVNRQQSYAVTTLGKTSFRDNTGTMQDANLYIGGAQSNSPWSTGFGALFFTQGFDSTGADAVPLKYQILEDEWRYTKISPIGGSSYRNQIYDFYNVYPGSLGLIVQFCASTNRPAGDGFGSGWNQRKFHVYNAPPSCDIKVNPEPVINERGTDSDVNFQFIPIGGYGPGNVKITFTSPNNNIYLPTKDSDNQPINQQFNKSIPMNGSTLNITAKIRSTPAATVKKYLLKVTIEDLVLGIKIDRYFEFIIVYPKPGFTVGVSPSLFDLYQGDCPINQCCSDSCKMVNVDLISRNDFEDNVVAGIVWINQPPSQDVTLKWKQSSFVYDFIDDKTIEAITRKNIGTRYQLQVNVTPNTTVGTWKFKIFFISGLLKRSQTVTFTVAPAKPGIKITSNPPVIRVVPGGIASYRLMIESTNGFVGKVNLTLQNLPPNVTVITYKAELPPLGYADNYVEISPGHPAYANLVVQTYSYTAAPSAPKAVTVVQYSEKLVYISWEFSTKGSYPIAGYEVWRATSQYIDTATRLGIVGSGENTFNDNSFVSNRTYYYFIRAFDNQNPPNYSTYAYSGEVKTASVSNSFATVSNEGTLPGFTNIDIVGQGVGFGPDDQAVAPVGHGISVLHVYEQVKDMATPSFTWLGALFLLISMIAVFIFMMEKKAKKIS